MVSNLMCCLVRGKYPSQRQWKVHAAPSTHQRLVPFALHPLVAIPPNEAANMSRPCCRSQMSRSAAGVLPLDLQLPMQQAIQGMGCGTRIGASLGCTRACLLSSFVLGLKPQRGAVGTKTGQPWHGSSLQMWFKATKGRCGHMSKQANPGTVQALNQKLASACL